MDTQGSNSSLLSFMIKNKMKFIPRLSSFFVTVVCFDHYLHDGLISWFMLMSHFDQEGQWARITALCVHEVLSNWFTYLLCVLSLYGYVWHHCATSVLLYMDVIFVHFLLYMFWCLKKNLSTWICSSRERGFSSGLSRLHGSCMDSGHWW